MKLKLLLRYRLKNSAPYVSDQYGESENQVDLRAVKSFKIKALAAEWFVHIENLFDAGFEVHHPIPTMESGLPRI